MKFNTLEEISKLTIKSIDNAKFYITLDNPDKTREIIFYLDCSYEDAKEVFCYVIAEQQKEYRKPDNKNKWRVVRLFNSDDNQLAQES